ncbi:tyrosine-type recombinase/integrase [Terrisporobacter mayombei]|uniref:Tyrosine recombinase XerC n=1 Tax=Terrisporobacter mayombei TaxID=1541 RepID=A0ABY9PZB4_9FIRM|nr:site-specific integrase [Terrisporobacter mayombei]MCC3868557.1 site-specific integrase [Terrisporobacter mayombei]WMT80714.1 Tyrosine recombinase XerC [Terrisporobacter mayombei]
MSTAFIRKRSKNYIVYLEYLDKKTNKKKQKNMGSYPLKRDASKRLNEVKEEIYNDELLVPNEMVLEDYILDFLEKYKINLSITTYKVYTRICKKYIIPLLGDIKLCEIKPIHVQDYVDDLLDLLTPQTIKVHLNVLNLSLKRAYRLKLIKENPVQFVEVPKNRKYKNEIYNAEDMQKLLEKCYGTSMELPIVLAGGLGLRISEILGLTWNNVDFSDFTITIDKITVRNDGEVILKDPKTESSIRTISAPKEVILMLKQLKKDRLAAKLRGEKSHRELIFYDKNLNPVAPDVLSKKFRLFLKDNNLKHIRFHDLRHSHVTLLIDAKVPIKVISERVGHSNINTTLNIYSHALKEMDQEASDKISSTLFNKDRKMS